MHKITMVDGKLFRGPRLSFPGCHHLANDLFVKHVIDLEAGLCTIFSMDPDDERKNVEFFGMEYVPHPLSNFTAPTYEQCRAILRFIFDAKFHCYIHCHAGVDRTGFIVALYGALRYGHCPHEMWDQAYEQGMHLRYRIFWKKAFFERVKELREEFGWHE